MNKYIVIVIIFLGIQFNVSAVEAQEKRYGIKTAVIEYDIEGHMVGQETAYIDDWGEKEARQSAYKLQMRGYDRLLRRLTVRKGDIVHNLDLDKFELVQFDLNKEVTKGLGINMTAKEMSDYSPEGLSKMGAIEIGTETIAGKNCKIYKLPFLHAQVWVYENIALKYKSKTRAFIATFTATNIKEDVDIPAERFVLPKGYVDKGIVPENNLIGAIQRPITDAQ